MSYPPPPPGSHPASGQPTAEGQPAPAGQSVPGVPYNIEKTKRPFKVTLVAFLTFLAGALDIVAGVLMLVYRNNIRFAYNIEMTPSNIFYTGIAAIVVGVLVVLLSFGLFGGSRLARAVVALVCFLRVAAAIVVVVVAVTQTARLDAVLQGALSVLVLLLLFSGAKTKRFFHTTSL
jgi:lysylphosphatidylglycerol synthetase-like protein (DUF2156 family)